MCLIMSVLVMYFFCDTYAIVSGQYNKMISKDDYIYGSVRLFSDFVLCLSLLTVLFGG